MIFLSQVRCRTRKHDFSSLVLFFVLKKNGSNVVARVSRSLGFNAAKNGEPCDPQGLRAEGFWAGPFFSLSHLHTRAENNHIRLQKAASQSLPWQFRRSTFDSLWSKKMFLDGERKWLFTEHLYFLTSMSYFILNHMCVNVKKVI